MTSLSILPPDVFMLMISFLSLPDLVSLLKVETYTHRQIKARHHMTIDSIHEREQKYVQSILDISTFHPDGPDVGIPLLDKEIYSHYTLSLIELIRSTSLEALVERDDPACRHVFKLLRRAVQSFYSNYPIRQIGYLFPLELIWDECRNLKLLQCYLSDAALNKFYFDLIDHLQTNPVAPLFLTKDAQRKRRQAWEEWFVRMYPGRSSPYLTGPRGPRGKRGSIGTCSRRLGTNGKEYMSDLYVLYNPKMPKIDGYQTSSKTMLGEVCYLLDLISPNWNS